MKQIKFCTCPKCGCALRNSVFATQAETKYNRSCDKCTSWWTVTVPPIGSPAKIAIRLRPKVQPQ